MNTEERRLQQQEVDANYAVMQDRIPDLIGEHTGKFALMKDGEIVEFFDSREDAIKYGNMQYHDGIFSVQKVSCEVVHLGILSCI